MKPEFDLLAIINTLGAVQCLLISIALVSTKTGNRLANRHLAFFLLILSLFIFDEILYNSGLYQFYPYTYGWGTIFDFLIAPSFYLYVIALTTNENKIIRKQIAHFVLPLFILILQLPEILQSSAEKISTFLSDKHDNLTLEFFDYVFNFLQHIYISSYLVFTLVILNRAQKDDHLSKNIPVKFTFLKRLTYALLIVLAIHMFFFYSPYFDESSDVYLLFMLTIIVYMMAFIGLRQSEIFTADLLNINPPKYKKSTLTEDVSESVIINLENLMEKEELFKDSTLKLPDLASRLKVTTHQLSQIINEKFEKNFFNYLNYYRIESAKEILKDPSSENRTMPDIAFEVGFNSLSVFNSAFKKVTEMSPSEYRKQN